MNVPDAATGPPPPSSPSGSYRLTPLVVPIHTSPFARSIPIEVMSSESSGEFVLLNTSTERSGRRWYTPASVAHHTPPSRSMASGFTAPFDVGGCVPIASIRLRVAARSD